ncbi:hypothetical protein NMG60_11000869 [Bertholletia excelsa]
MLIMSTGLKSPFLGFPLQTSVNTREKGHLVYLDSLKPPKRFFRRCTCSKQNYWVSQGIRFSHFCGRNVEFLRKKLGWRGGLVLKRVTEPFSGDKALVRSLAPLWEEGLLLIRCSVFCAVISGVCLLIWYGQAKAKSFVEAKLLPSVCSVLSEYIQRELDFGKVQRISPLSITLESCSVGPHSEEFSCGEVPTVKLRVLPFASLRRGKIVVDAILSNPSLLIVQKKDYTWLGIPFSEGSIQRHLSTEEGIDYRTKTRRIAREETASRFEKERDDAAMEAANNGYSLSEKVSSTSEVDISRESAYHPIGLANSESFFFMDERLHRRDHHCMDAGIEYDLKHADLEKAFGVKASGSGVKFWSRFVPGPVRHKFKRKANGRDVSTSNITVKRRILERSASAAHSYFLRQSHGKSDDPFDLSGGHINMNIQTLPVKSQVDTSPDLYLRSSNNDHTAAYHQNGAVDFGGENNTGFGKVEETGDYLTSGITSDSKNETKVDITCGESSEALPLADDKDSAPGKEHSSNDINCFTFLRDPFLVTLRKLLGTRNSGDKFSSITGVVRSAKSNSFNVLDGDLGVDHLSRHGEMPDKSSRLEDQRLESLDNLLESEVGHRSQGSTFMNVDSLHATHHSIHIWPLSLKLGLPSLHMSLGDLWTSYFAGPVQKLKSEMGVKAEGIIAEFVEEVDEGQTSDIEKLIPFTLDSVHFKNGTLMLLAYGDKEPREMENANGHVKFQNHYGRLHVQLSGNCSTWRSRSVGEDGGWLSSDVFVDILEQKWHANLKVVNIFAPLFERILEIPIIWSNGRATGEVHICMSRGETFPNIHGQLDVTGLAFQIYDSPSWFSDMSASLCFRGQRIFLHNASGWFGKVPLEASGDFGINPEEGEFHLMCQLPCVEVNALMKTFKMKPLLFPLAGSVTAVFNCQGPLDAPVFVGSGLVSRKIAYSLSDFPISSASEAMMKSKDAGAVAAVDRVPFSYISANFTFNTDNCIYMESELVWLMVEKFVGQATWVCPEGEVDETAMDVNFSGNLCFDNIMQRYLPGYLQLMPFKLGDLNGETKVSGSLLKPRFDIKWTAPKAEGSFTDARGDIIISHDYISVSSSSIAFELSMKVQTSYPDEYWLNRKDCGVTVKMPIIVEGVDLDLRMRNFEFFNLVSSYPLDSLRPIHLKATGRIKFQGKVIEIFDNSDEQLGCSEEIMENMQVVDDRYKHSLSGEVSISGLKLNQLMLAPQLAGTLSIARECIKLDATGRPDESLAVEFVGPLRPSIGANLNGKLLSFSLHKGHLKANVCYRPLHSANLEVRHLPLDELELASLRGTLQRV